MTCELNRPSPAPSGPWPGPSYEDVHAGHLSFTNGTGAQGEAVGTAGDVDLAAVASGISNAWNNNGRPARAAKGIADNFLHAQLFAGGTFARKMPPKQREKARTTREIKLPERERLFFCIANLVSRDG